MPRRPLWMLAAGPVPAAVVAVPAMNASAGTVAKPAANPYGDPNLISLAEPLALALLARLGAFQGDAFARRIAPQPRRRRPRAARRPRRLGRTSKAALSVVNGMSFRHGPRVCGVLTDAEVPGFWRGLGLPGLVDIHVHFYPERMLRRVWQYFDAAFWPITYRWPDDARVAHLAALGVRAYPALSYAHRPGMAADLTAWALDFTARTPGCLPSGTFYPEPGVLAEIDKALAAGVRVFKVHVQVGDFDPRDELLDPVWGRLAETGTPVVVHAGSGPLKGQHTGPGPLADVLARNPRLTAVVAHLGVPEYVEFLDLAERYPRVHLDTTMACTDFLERIAPYPPSLLPRLGELGRAGRVLLGSDFPNIPYPYAHQLEALARLDLGDDWLRAVCWDNGAALFDVARIRPADAGDHKALQDIERAAGELFRDIGMPEIADDPPFTRAELLNYMDEGRAWVAVDGAGRPVGYLLADLVDGAVHVEQVSVHPDAARQGIGRALIDHVARWAGRKGAEAVTLTTFRDVPWNASYYLRLGFRRLAEEELGPQLRAVRRREAAQGLDRWPRVCLRRDLGKG